MCGLKIDVKEDWKPLLKEDTKTLAEKKKINWIILVTSIIAGVIAINIFTFYELVLARLSGKRVIYLYFSVSWLVIILFSSVITTLIVIFYIFQKCHNSSGVILEAVIGNFAIMIGLHYIMNLMYHLTFLQSSVGYFYGEIIFVLLKELILVGLCIIITMFIINLIIKKKQECDIVLKGRKLDKQFVTDSKIGAVIECKELRGKTLCKVPRIESLKK